MSEKKARRGRRPRLDADARDRMLARIGRITRPPAAEIDEASEALRAILRETPIDAAPEIAEPAPEPTPPTTAAPPADVARAWANLAPLDINAPLLERNLVITAARTDPAHGAFDVLRTRLVQALADKGWSRVAITSPTAGCGKSFTAVNLAITLSRYDNCRTILLDMDMRRPGLARYLGASAPGAIGDMLRGQTPPARHLVRPGSNSLQIGSNLAFGMNGQVEDYAAELFQQPSTAAALAEMDRQFQPEVTLFDMPPALAQDDVIACRPHFDCVLMVVGGGMTRAEEVTEATRRIGEDKPILGIMLNKADEETSGAYSY